MNKLSQLSRLIGNTPSIKITYKFNGKVYNTIAKCEWYNLTGSIKDRVAYQIIKDAYSQGVLKEGQPIVEVSSGNMGISLTAIGTFLQHKTTIIMPKTMSDERKKLITLYGGELIETDSFKQAFEWCQQLQAEGYYSPNQFANTSNSDAHLQTTAQELLQVISPEYQYFVSGVGTGGTLSGVSQLLSPHNIKCVAIEPVNAPILTKPPPYHSHMLQGLSDEICPPLYNPKTTYQVLQISDNDAIAMSLKLSNTLALGVGISGGANFLGCVLCNGNAITIFPDDNKKYLTTTLTTPISTPLVDSIDLLSLTYPTPKRALQL